jgi:hypothetical protein
MRLKAGLRCSRSSGLNAAEAIAHKPRHGRQADDNNYWEPAKNTPLQSRIGSRPHITLYGDGWGEGFGAWGLVCGDRDQRGAGVTPAPLRLCPTWNRPGVPQG